MNNSLIDHKSVQVALEIATEAHSGQTRKDGSPYINHPIRVAESFWCLNDDPNVGVLRQATILSLLHDVLEDCDRKYVDVISEQVRRQVFGKYTMLELELLTKINSYAGYISTLIEGSNSYNTKIPLLVKLADLKDNLSDLENGNRRDKYELARLLIKNHLASYHTRLYAIARSRNLC